MIKQHFDRLSETIREAGYGWPWRRNNPKTKQFHFIIVSGTDKGKKVTLSDRGLSGGGSDLIVVPYGESPSSDNYTYIHYSKVNLLDDDGNEIKEETGPVDMFGREIEVGDWIACCTMGNHQRVGKVQKISKNGIPSAKWVIEDGKPIECPNTTAIKTAEKSIKLPLDGSFMTYWVLSSYGKGVEEI